MTIQFMAKALPARLRKREFAIPVGSRGLHSTPPNFPTTNLISFSLRKFPADLSPAEKGTFTHKKGIKITILKVAYKCTESEVPSNFGQILVTEGLDK